MRKQCKRKHVAKHIPAMIYKLEKPAGEEVSALEWRITLAGIMNQLKDGTFGHHQCNQLYEYINTCFVVCKMANNHEAYRQAERMAEAFTALCDRRREKGKWIATGDEIRTLAVLLDSFAEEMAKLPASTIKAAMITADLEAAKLARYYAGKARGN